ncbi:hypothetical protein [Yoonia sp.]|uniref:hypothetical protein n=1 Tax=Yoonia sp. TaxID=2212373 RepID=UPI0025F2E6DE|nr:hypothetical protein [Yoonia sp.]
MSDFNASGGNGQMHFAKTSSFTVEDIYWGYMVRSGLGPSIGVVIAQAASFFLGACLLTAAIGILVLPTLMFDGDIGVMRMGAATLFGAMAAYLLWFASRGTRAELHVDTSVGEIREVICNRAGRPTTVGCYGFDTIGGVFLDEREDENWATLVLRYRNTAQTVCVAEGTEAQLMPLRDRLGQDLMVQAKTTRSRAA